MIPLRSSSFSVGLAAAVVASFAMRLDAVSALSGAAYHAGTIAAALAAVPVLVVATRFARRRARAITAAAGSTVAGALVGALVQTMVLREWSGVALFALGDRVSTHRPLSWVLAGAAAGAMVGLLATLLVWIALEARRIVGGDRSESFAVPFLGIVGLAATVMLATSRWRDALPPIVVTGLCLGALGVALVRDVARARWVRRVFAGDEPGLEVRSLPACAEDAALEPVVGRAVREAVIVRACSAAYRGAAAMPLARVATTREETVRPLLRRVALAAVLLAVLAGTSAFFVALLLGG